MDDPSLDDLEHICALKGLERLNRLSGSGKTIWEPVKQLAQEIGSRSLKVLDIACGGGDTAIDLALKATKSGLPIHIDGCDISSTALSYAKSNAERVGAKVEFFRMDVLNDELPESSYDAVMTSLFVHHLNEDEVCNLLERMQRWARHLILVNDLERSPLNFALVWLATRSVTRSRVVHFDGPVSVRRAYTIAEVKELAIRSNLPEVKIQRCFPCRFMLQARVDGEGR